MVTFKREALGAGTLLALLLVGWVFPGFRRFDLVVGVVAVLVTWPTLIEAANGLRQRRINIELFNSLALVASCLLREYTSAAFIAMMLASARILSEITRGRARRSVEELIKMRPKTVWVDRGGSLAEIEPASLRPEDIVVIREGERVPVDGEVIGGEAVVNEAPVTGESRPVLKVRGAQVISPSIVIKGTLKVAPRRLGADTTLERIIRLIEEAESAKAPAQRLADRFATWFLPIVLALAGGAYFFTGNPRIAIALLVVVCADDIAVSVPLAFFAAIGRAAKRGVIINGGDALERLGKLTHVLFDKTGTLTYGQPRVEKVSLATGIDEGEFWAAVGSVEKFSKHPFAQAVLDEVAARHLVPPDPEDFDSNHGHGVSALVGGLHYAAGSRAALAEAGVTGLPPADSGMEGAWCFSRDGRFFGLIVVTDLPRREAREAISELKRLGIERTNMLTGDVPEVAERVGRQLGIDEVNARLSPEDKVDLVRKINTADKVVGMVGDGINDAPALAAADVGIAMGGAGTVVAIETAQVVIMNDRLDRLPEIIRLSRFTRRVVIGDFAIWSVTNVIGIAAVLLGILNPGSAALYNFLTDFLPLLNSARLFSNRPPSNFKGN